MNHYTFIGLRKNDQLNFLSSLKSNTPEEIIKKVSEILSVDHQKVTSRSRKRELVEARFISSGIIKKMHKNMTLNQIGNMFGGRDHATIIYSLKMFDELYEFNKTFRRKVELIGQNLN